MGSIVLSARLTRSDDHINILVPLFEVINQAKWRGVLPELVMQLARRPRKLEYYHWLLITHTPGVSPQNSEFVDTETVTTPFIISA